MQVLPSHIETPQQPRPMSLLFGRDPDALRLLLDVHATPNPRILDCTHNKGTMWAGLPEHVVGMDIERGYPVACVADCRALPFRDASFDVLVFDPPHLPVAIASAGSSGYWHDWYGLRDTTPGRGRDGDNIAPLFLPFLRESARVLVPNGVVLAKIADLTHNHRQHWQHVDLILAAREVGMTPCDLLVKVDPAAGNLKSGRWRGVKHLRKQHSFWLVVRNGARCERAA